MDKDIRGSTRPRWKGRPLQALLFDLDGTLVDSAGAVAQALDRALGEQGLPALARGQARSWIGRGAPTLVARALAHLEQPPGVEAARLVQRYEALYREMLIFDELRVPAFAGAAEGLRRLQGEGLRLAVVTNCAQSLAMELLQRAGLSHWIDVVVGGDSGAPRKPAAQPLLYACQALDVEPSQALMVGDSAVDLQAARAAGMPVVCVPYGYAEGADPRALPCDGFVDTLAGLPALLASGRATRAVAAEA